jgi:hypothetical protein
MKYLFLLNQSKTDHPAQGSAEIQTMYDEYGTAIAAMAEAGVLIDCAPLHAESDSTTVRVRNGETLVTDGPAAEIKEFLGGYTLVECADLDDALKWASTIPAARLASVEVRPVVPMDQPR